MQKAEDPSLSDDPWSPDDSPVDDLGSNLKLDDTNPNPNAESELEPELETVVPPPSQVHHGPTKMSVDQWLDSLRRADRAFYNTMAMEVWSIAKSMDTLIPGFWSKFMENRQIAMKQFIQERRTSNARIKLEDLENPEKPHSDTPKN